MKEQGEGKRRGQKVLQEKQEKMYRKIIEFIHRQPYTLYIDDYFIRRYIEELQQQYNNGKLLISTEEIKELISLELLVPIGQKQEMSEKYGISKQSLRYIYVKYGNIDKFINDYKSGEINLSEEEMGLCGIKNPRGIVLSKYDISAKQKKGYIRLLNDVCTPEQLETFYNSGYINIDDVNQLLQTLKEEHQEIIRKRYGLDDGNVRNLYQIANELGIVYQSIEALMENILDYIKVDVGNLVKSKDAYYEMQELLRKKNYGKGQSKKDVIKECCKLEEENSACAEAYYNFMRRESIFDPNQVIEATISKSRKNGEMLTSESEGQTEAENVKIINGLEERKRLQAKYDGIQREGKDADELLASLRKDLLAAGIIKDESSYRGEK